MIRTLFDLDYTHAGLLISAFSLSYCLGRLPAGWLADRIGFYPSFSLAGAAIFTVTLICSAWLWCKRERVDLQEFAGE